MHSSVFPPDAEVHGLLLGVGHHVDLDLSAEGHVRDFLMLEGGNASVSIDESGLPKAEDVSGPTDDGIQGHADPFPSSRSRTAEYL